MSTGVAELLHTSWIGDECFARLRSFPSSSFESDLISPLARDVRALCEKLLFDIGMPVQHGEATTVLLTHWEDHASVLDFAKTSDENEELLRRESFV